jgi:hypothetical protein
MTTMPQIMLAAGLIGGGVLMGSMLLTSAKNAPPRPPPAPKPISCQLGQLLIVPNCYPVASGTITMTLNTGNKFSTPGSEYADIYIASGSVRINDIYNSQYVAYHNAGETVSLAPFHIVTVLQPNTRLNKRPSW